MDPSKICSLFLIFTLFISTATPILGCGSCGGGGIQPPKRTKPGSGSHSPKGPIVLPPIIGKPPVTLPPIIGKPPVTLPPVIGKPPVTLPPIIGKPPIDLPPVGPTPVTLPPISLPPVTLPPIVPPVTLPPIGLPPVGIPPVLTKPAPGKKPCPPVSGKETCPIDTLKLGGCVDLLGGLIHIGLGDPAANECCPVLTGLAEVEAAVCLCTTLKIKALNLNLYVPIALQLLITCGKTPPPGYTCSL